MNYDTTTDHDTEGVGYCHDERHAEPCPLPCEACADECGR